MDISNINLKDVKINLKGCFKYTTENSIFLTHDDFLKICEAVSSPLKPEHVIFILNNEDGKDYFVEGKNDSTYVMKTDGDGSLIVIGSNNCDVVREGFGLGYAIRVGSGKGNATRICYENNVEGYNISKTYIGGAIRDGDGDGHSTLSTFSIGTCVRLGSGKGESFTDIMYNKGYIYQQTTYEYDILSLPKHLSNEYKDILAEVISYETFIEQAILDNGTFWIEASNKNIIILINDKSDFTHIGMRGDLVGTIEVRVNSHNSKDIMLTRAGLGNGSAIISGKGKGTCIRVGDGDGDAISMGQIMGAARKIGKGKGIAYKEDLTLGGISIIK